MADYERVRRKQVLREAEGYLELVIAGQELGSLPKGLRDEACLLALDSLAHTRFSGATLPQALLLEGQALKLMERYRDALDPLERSADLAPDNLHVWLALGWCHKRTGRLDLGIQSLESALELDGDDAIVPYNLACYWSLTGNRKLALAYLAQALELDPQYRDMVPAESDFDPIRDDPEFQTLTAVVV